MSSVDNTPSLGPFGTGSSARLFQGAFSDGGLAIGLSNFALPPGGSGAADIGKGLEHAGSLRSGKIASFEADGPLQASALLIDDEPGGADDSSHLLKAVLALTTD